tara:strand:- start:51362 stop:52597 length:1236 start_codon:yes stop_codon:yes gene_type:complete
MITCDSPGLAPLDQALESLLSFVEPIRDAQTIPLTEADGRVLAADVTSAMNVPPADNSAMDGYALRAADLADGDTLKLAGKSMAGHPFRGTLRAGECVRIMTGALVPAGADSVVMQENTGVADEGLIRFPHGADQGDNVRLSGEDIRAGQILLTAGRRLRPADVGLLASVGIAQVSVRPRLKVALLATGDELVEPGRPLADGQIYQSNSFTIATMLRRLGCEVLAMGTVQDSAAALRQAFVQADAEADVVMTTGGVSVGEADYTKDVLESLGRIDFWRLAIKPGKPFACGHLPSSLFIGLPGNPVSAMVTMHQLAAPMLRRLAGEHQVKPVRLRAQTSDVLRKRPGRTDFQRGLCDYDDHGQLHVRAVGNQSSAVLSSLSQANCYIVLEQERGRVEAGETVTVELFDGLML